MEHKISRSVVEYAVERQAGVLALGDVRDIADAPRKGRKQNQRLSTWRHGKLRAVDASLEGRTLWQDEGLAEKAIMTRTLLADDGTVYLPIDVAVTAKGQNQRLMKFAGQRVSASGKVFELHGSKAFNIEKIEAEKSGASGTKAHFI